MNGNQVSTLQQPIPSCPHQWQIAIAMVDGHWPAVCKLCGATRTFAGDLTRPNRFNSSGPSVPAVKQPESAKRGAILTLLRESSESLSLADVLHRTGFGSTGVRKVLTNLADEGLIERQGTTKKYTWSMAP